MVTVIIIISVLMFYPKHDSQEYLQQTYSLEEIEQAKKNINLALGYFAYCYQKTENIIEKEIIQNYIINPINSSFKSAIRIIINGG